MYMKEYSERNLLGLNCNKETSGCHTEELFDILNLKTFTKEDGGALFYGDLDEKVDRISSFRLKPM